MNANVTNLILVRTERNEKVEAIRSAITERCRALGLSTSATESCKGYGELMYHKYKVSPAAAVFAGNDLAYRVSNKSHGFTPSAA